MGASTTMGWHGVGAAKVVRSERHHLPMARRRPPVTGTAEPYDFILPRVDGAVFIAETASPARIEARRRLPRHEYWRSLRQTRPPRQ